jgi:hypothetical protein
MIKMVIPIIGVFFILWEELTHLELRGCSPTLDGIRKVVALPYLRSFKFQSQNTAWVNSNNSMNPWTIVYHVNYCTEWYTGESSGRERMLQIARQNPSLESFGIVYWGLDSLKFKNKLKEVNPRLRDFTSRSNWTKRELWLMIVCDLAKVVFNGVLLLLLFLECYWMLNWFGWSGGGGGERREIERERPIHYNKIWLQCVQAYLYNINTIKLSLTYSCNKVLL